MRVATAFVLAASFLGPLQAQQLAKLDLVYKGHVDTGSHFIQYNFAVSNYTAYPEELFRSAPDLPPCGRNRNSSRTWVEIFGETGSRIYGFCALTASAELQNLWFAIPNGTPPPKWIRVVLKDRRTGRTVQGRLDIPKR